MHSSRTTRTATLAATLLLFASCGGEHGRDAAGADADADRTAPTVTRADAGRTERPARIYYDLTRFDWYRKGEPLRAEGREFMPAGALVTAAHGDFRRAGEYDGVDYYVRTEGTDSLLFVPVFDRYWLPFATTSARRAD